MDHYVITAKQIGRLVPRVTISRPMTVEKAEKRAARLSKEMSELRPRLRIFQNIQVTPQRYASMPDGYIF